MRVVLVAETFLPAVNGVVNSVVHVAGELADRGHQPVVVAPSGSAIVSPAGRRIDVVRVPSMSLPGYPGLRVGRPGHDLRPLLRDLDPDILHLASPAILGWSAVCAAGELSIPVVAAFQTDLSAYLRRYRLGGGSAVLWGGLRRLHNRADLTLVPSSATVISCAAMASDRSRRGHVGSMPTCFIPGGVTGCCAACWPVAMGTVFSSATSVGLLPRSAWSCSSR